MSFTKVAPAGIGTEPGTSIRIGDSLLHSTGIDIGTGTGIGVTIRKHGHATFTGIITASAFSGDGSSLTGVASTDNIKTSTTANFTGGIQVGGATTFTGDVGIAGTLTYEDVTNVDSVGVITARSTIDAQGDVSIADKIVHTGDTNTTIRFPAADTISFETAGSPRARIDSSGRLLVNTTTTHSSNQIMIVKGASPSGGGNRPYDGQLAIENTETSGAINTGGVLAFIGHDGNTSRGFGSIRNLKEDGTTGNYGTYMSFETRTNGSAPAEKLRITSGGLVGVNCTPVGMFEVQKNGVPAIIANYNNSKHIQMGAGANGAGFHFTDGLFFTINHQPYADRGTDNNLTERLHISATGNVGINESAPDNKLHITHSNATEDVIKLLAKPVTAATGERSRIVFHVHQSNNQAARLGYIASHTLNGWGGELSFHTKPANSTPNNTTNEIMRLHASGETTFNGNINLSGSATATNQNRQIYFTGFDKEATSDFSDYAYIRHTTNVHGITGSVLELRAENDATDGIALHAGGGNGQIAFAGKIRGNIEMHDYGGRIRPSYGTGDKGISWQPDPAGGSGDSATIQYYTDGSGEDTRLRIFIANDAQDDLRLEGPTVRIQGSFSKSSGSFRIPHVLSGLTTTTDLVHSFVEGPQADNLYRGRTTLVAGISTVNIDTTNNMTEGTFVNLNRDVQCFTTNETGWTAIKGSVTGNLLTIVAQDNTCTDTISWMVIGERWDLAMYDPTNPMTDANGKVKTEIPNNSYNKGGGFEEDYISENRHRVGISTFFRPSIENKEVE